MLKRTDLLFAAAIFGLLLAGCPDSTQPMSDGQQTDPLDECEPYDSITMSGEIDGEWTQINDENNHTFTVPVEAGAGIVEVTISGAPVGPNLVVHIGSGGGAVGNDAADASQTARLVFEVAPGQEVQLTAESFNNASSDAYPVPYTIRWTYTSRVDCYEPNDSQDEAKGVPTDEVHEAYFLSKRRGNFHDDTHDDWYRFTLANDGDVTVRLLTLPSDIVAEARIFDASGAQIAGKTASTVGEVFEFTADGLAAGEYSVKFEVIIFSTGTGTSQGDEANSSHFDDTYTFRIDTN